MKSVQLTDDEIIALLVYYSSQLNGEMPMTRGLIDDSIERLRYLNKRLNDKKTEAAPNSEKKEW